MKVEEAKTKVCPFIQSGHEIAPIVNGVSVMNIRCICSDCMAWKWSIEDYDIDDDFEPIETYSTTDGYCARIGQ